MTLRLSLLAALLLTACADDGTPWQDLLPVDHAKADAAPVQKLVISHLELPTLPTENDALGFDLDDRLVGSHKAIDNKLGAILQLVQIVDHGWFTQATADAQVAAGQHLLLLELRSAADDPNAVVRTTPGHPAGTSGFAADPDASPDNALYGIFQHGELDSGEVGTILIDLALTPDGVPIRFRLVGAHIQLIADQNGHFHGHLGGGIPKADLKATILPAVFQRVHAYVTANPDAVDTEKLRQLLDTNKDRVILEDEFMASNVVQTVFSPDLDLLTDASLPAIALGPDGTKDCVSAGIGFDAVPATF